MDYFKHLIIFRFAFYGFNGNKSSFKSLLLDSNKIIARIQKHIFFNFEIYEHAPLIISFCCANIKLNL